MIVDSLRIGPEKNLAYLIKCEESGEAALVDPAYELDRIQSWIEGTHGPVQIKFLLATHWHSDHAGKMGEAKRLFPEAQIAIQELDVAMAEQLGYSVDRHLKSDEVLSIGNTKLKVIHTPGHSEGGCCFLVGDQLLTGDTLFVGNCGRTDLPGGDDKKLFESLQLIKTLDPQLIIRPGHDYGATPSEKLGNEMLTNPTLQAKTLNEFTGIP